MRTNRVGDEMIRQLRLAGCFSVTTLDGLMGDVGYDLDLKLHKGMGEHPMNRCKVAASWLERDDRFEKNLIKAHDSLGRSRTIRSFRLKPEFTGVEA